MKAPEATAATTRVPKNPQSSRFSDETAPTKRKLRLWPAILLAANPKKLEELGRFQAIEGKTWNHPIVAHGRLYARNGEEMACYELPTTTAR